MIRDEPPFAERGTWGLGRGPVSKPYQGCHAGRIDKQDEELVELVRVDRPDRSAPKLFDNRSDRVAVTYHCADRVGGLGLYSFDRLLHLSRPDTLDPESTAKLPLQRL